jgi:hypothetical protein
MLLTDNFQTQSLAVADVAAGGSIGTAPNTVDSFAAFVVTQTTAGQTLSLPNPSAAFSTFPLQVYVANNGTASFTMHTSTVKSGSYAIFMWSGTAWLPLTDTDVLVKKFRAVQALVAGNNVITHNLGVLTPFAVQVEVRDNGTGAIVTARVVTETANSTTINVGAAVASARITILG